MKYRWPSFKRKRIPPQPSPGPRSTAKKTNREYIESQKINNYLDIGLKGIELGCLLYIFYWVFTALRDIKVTNQNKDEVVKVIVGVVLGPVSWPWMMIAQIFSGIPDAAEKLVNDMKNLLSQWTPKYQLPGTDLMSWDEIKDMLIALGFPVYMIEIIKKKFDSNKPIDDIPKDMDASEALKRWNQWDTKEPFPADNLWLINSGFITWIDPSGSVKDKLNFKPSERLQNEINKSNTKSNEVIWQISDRDCLLWAAVITYFVSSMKSKVHTAVIP